MSGIFYFDFHDDSHLVTKVTLNDVLQFSKCNGAEGLWKLELESLPSDLFITFNKETKLGSIDIIKPTEKTVNISIMRFENYTVYGQFKEETIPTKQNLDYIDSIIKLRNLYTCLGNFKEKYMNQDFGCIAVLIKGI
jgi:hypothetical protein